MAEAGSLGPVWATVVQPGRLRLTEPTVAAALSEWEPECAGLLPPQPAAAQSKTTIAVTTAAPRHLTSFYASGVSVTKR